MKKTWLLTLVASAMILPLSTPAQAQPDYGHVDVGHVDIGHVDRGRVDSDRDRGRDYDRRDDRRRDYDRYDDRGRGDKFQSHDEKFQSHDEKVRASRGRWVRDNDWRHWSRYDWNRPDGDGYYYADRYYRSGSVVRVTRQTRIYRGSDNRYYCRRSDGTTGLVVGAALGGVIGNRLGHGRSNVIGTLLGAGIGAALGKSIDRGQVTCR